MIDFIGGLADPPLCFASPAEAVGFGYLDARFAFVRVNERLAEITGLPVAAHLGKTLGEVADGFFLPMLAAAQGLAASGENWWQQELWPGGAAGCGGPRCYRIDLVPQREPDGRLLGVAMRVADVSREKSAAWTLAERLHEQRLWAQLSPQLGGGPRRYLAHELRNRLMPMLTVAQMLKEPAKLDWATLEWAGQSMEKKVLELSDLANLLSRSSEGAVAEPQVMDFCQLAVQAVELVRPLLSRHSVSLPGQGAWVLGAPDRLLHAVALCVLGVARGACGLGIRLDADAQHAVLAIVGYPGGGAGPDVPPPFAAAEKPPGMGLALAEAAFGEQEGSLSVLEPTDGNPCPAIHLRLLLADPLARLSV